MCGIAGIFQPQGGSVDQSILANMTHRLAHRGPDGHGFFYQQGIGLGHRRLAIIDPEGGQQPLSTVQGDVTVCFNGEIYNFRQLADQLSGLGYEFRTRCDTEVLLYAWQQWGEQCVDHLRGMFAFAIWDQPRQTLFLARDRLGIKPLYYSQLADNTLLFASELKALRQHPRLGTKLCHQALNNYLAYGYVPAPQTIFQQSYKLSPGHTLTLCRGQSHPVINRYWDLKAQPVAVDQHTAGEQLTHQLRQAVDLRMIADVPLGAFLSGGIDSSGVVATMSQLSPDPVRTCSIGFDDAAFDEAAYAQQVADHCGTLHQLQTISSSDFSLWRTLAEQYDEPFADSSALPTYRLCQLARQQVTVALSGDGGDEVFAGYSRYQWFMKERRWREKLPQTLRRWLHQQLPDHVAEKPRWRKRAHSLLQGLSMDDVAAYFNIIAIVKNPWRHRLLSPSFLANQNHPVDLLHHYARQSPSDDPLTQLQYLDVKTYLADDILTKVDRASMAHSLEVRVPLIDHQLMEWAWTIPSNLHWAPDQSKKLFKKALEPLLPHNILYRKKMGFAVPLAAWFRGPMQQPLRQALLSDSLLDQGVLRREGLLDLLDQHQQGQQDHSAMLWSLMMLSAFTESL